MLNRQTKLSLALSVAFATLSISLAYEIKEFFPSNSAWIKIFGVIAALVLSPQLGIAFVSMAYQNSMLRRLLSGSSWVEGVWIIRTFVDSKVTNGVSQVYRDDTGELMVRIFFPQAISDSSGPSFSISDNVFLRERDLFYTNSFVSSGPTGKVLGVATGYFLRDLNLKHANRYEGNVFYSSGGISVRQVGFKLPDSFVKRLIAEHGQEGWIQKALELDSPESKLVK